MNILIPNLGEEILSKFSNSIYLTLSKYFNQIDKEVSECNILAQKIIEEINKKIEAVENLRLQFKNKFELIKTSASSNLIFLPPTLNIAFQFKDLSQDFIRSREDINEIKFQLTELSKEKTKKITEEKGIVIKVDEFDLHVKKVSTNVAKKQKPSNKVPKIPPKKMPKEINELRQNISKRLYTETLLDRKFNFIYTDIFSEKDHTTIKSRLGQYLKSKKINLKYYQVNKNRNRNCFINHNIHNKYWKIISYDYHSPGGVFYTQDLSDGWKYKWNRYIKLKLVPTSMDYFLDYQFHDFKKKFCKYFYKIRGDTIYFYGEVFTGKNNYHKYCITYFFEKEALSAKTFIAMKIKYFGIVEDMLSAFDEEEIDDHNLEEDFIKEVEESLKVISQVRQIYAYIVLDQLQKIYPRCE
jgi:hypothetical protein